MKLWAVIYCYQIQLINILRNTVFFFQKHSSFVQFCEKISTRWFLWLIAIYFVIISAINSWIVKLPATTKRWHKLNRMVHHIFSHSQRHHFIVENIYKCHQKRVLISLKHIHWAVLETIPIQIQSNIEECL